MSESKTRRDKQYGKAIVRLLGERGDILFPDSGAPSLKVRVRKYQNKPGDGHGSHHNGKHKLG